MSREPIDSPSRISDLRDLIGRKFGLKMFYLEAYHKFANCLNQCQIPGKAVEIGSGASFAKKIIPEILTSDVITYEGLDMILDGTQMPFTASEVKFFGMLNVLHHVPDAKTFFSEISRCLAPGGRVLIIDQHVGWWSEIIFKYLHHEGFDKSSPEWKFKSSGPLSGANGALAWIIFQRDRALFEQLYPKLKIASYSPHSPLIYWLSGGMKLWTLTPRILFPLMKLIDRFFLWMSPGSACFVDIELIRME